MDRYAMNTARIEQLLDELGIPLPAHVAKTRSDLDKVALLGVVQQPVLSTNRLASVALGRLRDGQEVDLLRILEQNAANAQTADADALLKVIQQDAETLHSTAITGSAGAILPLAQREVEKVLSAVRALPQDTATSAEAAIDGDTDAVKSLHALRVLAARYGMLRALHHELIAGDVDPTGESLFGDCQHWPTLGMVRAERAGPTDLLHRLLWLATDEAQAWVPSGPECTAHYMTWLEEARKPKTPATPLHAKPVTI